MPESEFQDVILDLLHLRKGRHKSAADGMSPMEAVAWLAGEKHSDHPECACPVIAAYVGRIADWASDEQRQQLRVFLPRLIRSRSAEHMAPRAEYLVRQAVTVFLPLMYDELKQSRIAIALRALPADATLMELRESIGNARRIFAATGTAAIAIVHADAAVRAAAYVADLTAAAAAARHAAAAAAAAGDAIRYKADWQVPGNNTQQKLWSASLAALDGVLAIGPAGSATLTPDMIERLKAYLKLSQQGA